MKPQTENPVDDRQADPILRWCASVLGPFEVTADNSREHPGERASAYRLKTPAGKCYVKVHRDPGHWENEVHAYERWAPAFGTFAPRLIAVRAEKPLALVISELPGKVLEEVSPRGQETLSRSQQQAIWGSAGRALAGFHNLAVGDTFGPCRRDGSPAGAVTRSAVDYVSADLDNLVERGLRINCLSEDDLAVVHAARALVPAFAGERPVPCHRDYCPANWLVTEDGAWSGVIDFEFAYWDVRVADFTRYPNWDWIGRPDLTEAFFEGYGRSFTPAEEQQRLVGHVLYALVAIVWGEEVAYHGFAAEGRQALAHLAGQLR